MKHRELTPQEQALDNRILNCLQINALNGKNIVCAFSGGLDSTVLLHAAHRVFSRPSHSSSLSACHVDHGLNPAHRQWADHCRSICTAMHVPLTISSVKISRKSQGVEAGARRARYAVFESLLTSSESILLTAHHLDDQAETLLLNMTRSLGFHSQRGIPEERPLGAGNVFRPFIGISRNELMSYAGMHDLRWIEDDSNSDQAFDRNFIRQNILPSISKRWPHFRKNIALSAYLANRQIALLDEIAIDDLEECVDTESPFGSRLDLELVSELSHARQSNLLARWFREHNVVHINREQWRQIHAILRAGEVDACNNTELQLKADCGDERHYAIYDGYLLKLHALDQNQSLDALNRFLNELLQSRGADHASSIPERTSVRINNFGELQVHIFRRVEESLTLRLPLVRRDKEINFSWRFASEFTSLEINGMHKRLKNLFQQARVPKWFRPGYPVLCANNDPIAIPGVAVADQFSANEQQNGEETLLLSMDWRFSR